MLWPDDFGWPQDIGALAILDGQGLVDADGRVRIEDVRQAVDARLHLVPRFRQLLYVPGRGLGLPLWVDAARFDLKDHVRVARVGSPGDEVQLLRTVEHLRRRRLDRSRPLWEMWLLTGLSEGRLGLFVKAHHAIADGVAGVDLFGRLLDTAAGVHSQPVMSWRPAPVPSSRELFADNIKRRVAALGHALSASTRPVAGLRRAWRLWPWVTEIFGQRPAPRTSFNWPLGPDRTFTLNRGSLDAVKKTAHAHDATVNDVLMAAIAGGLRDLMRSRGERVEGVVLRTIVPVSLHGKSGQAQGNSDGAMFVSLPIGVPDPVRRLELIAAQTSERKKHEHPAGGMLLRNGFVQRIFTRHMARQRWVNVYVANVPGPKTQLHLAGAPLVELFPVVPLTGNLTLGVGALSYAGQFNITVVADPDTCPDADVFAEGIGRTLQSLACPRRAPGRDLYGRV